jgi:hypothetical protein
LDNGEALSPLGGGLRARNTKENDVKKVNYFNKQYNLNLSFIQQLMLHSVN